jgi:hypothetical protein
VGGASQVASRKSQPNCHSLVWPHSGRRNDTSQGGPSFLARHIPLSGRPRFGPWGNLTMSSLDTTVGRACCAVLGWNKWELSRERDGIALPYLRQLSIDIKGTCGE